MASLIFSAPMITRNSFINLKAPRQTNISSFPSAQRKPWPLLCTKLFPWEASTPHSSIDDDLSIIKGLNVVEPIDTEEPTELPLLQCNEDIINISDQQHPQHQQQSLKWPMWLMGPSILLATAILPTLWLPLSSVFLAPNIAGLLSLLGLDCIFNIGATLFLLMADACSSSSSSPPKVQVPLTYKLWNMGSSMLGFLTPILMMFVSRRGSLVPELPFISFAVLLGPYLVLLSVQMLTEMLTWHWKSPVWLVTPIVYEGYRILQLMRGLRLGIEVSAPEWAISGIRLLVSWWVFVLGIQLMRVAWFAGLNHRSQSNAI